MVRGIGASLCSEAAGHDAKRWLSRGIRATRNLALELFFVGTGALRGCTALKELRHMPRLAGFAGRARGRIAADLGLQLDDVDELVGLAAQLIGFFICAAILRHSFTCISYSETLRIESLTASAFSLRVPNRLRPSRQEAECPRRSWRRLVRRSA